MFKNSVQVEGDSVHSNQDSGEGEGSDHYIVGVGASAGGLEALEKFFESVPEKSGMAYIVVQHLSPDFKSHMDELLRRVTGMKVQVVENGVAVEPNVVYLIPPKSEMVINNGKLLLTERSPEKGLNHPIDMFFRSLASDCHRYAIGVVLSGTGSDGSRGVSEIAENGGLVIAQDPKTCKFDAMPFNATETGHVHLVLAPEAIGEALCAYVSEGLTPEVLREQQVGHLEEKGINRVFQLLQREHNIDFSHYKPGTVERRIQRRIELLKIKDLDAYVDRMNADGVEINDLYRDLLIGVTRFFRDQEAFEYLQKEVLPRLISKAGDEGLRVWVCGCATGEEAYSLAICISEAYKKVGKKPNYKMFATDAHKESLQYAATGIYSESKLEDLPQQYKTQYFNSKSDGYHVSTELRRHIVFAPHNLIADPPFTQMHLVTCRNLLIYFQPSAQRKSLSLFHFALRHNGILFLGPSESPGEIADEFEPLEKTWKVFRKRRDVRLPVDMRMPAPQQHDFRGVGPMRSSLDLPLRSNDVMPSLYDMILGDKMPPSLLIDAQFHLLHAFPGTEQYMRFVVGRPTTNVLELIYPAIKNSLAAAIQHSVRDNQAVRYTGMPHPSDPTKQVRLIVTPYKPGSGAQIYLLIEFETMDLEKVASNDSEYEDVDLGMVATTRIESLEQDLSYTQQNLQATIEELETSNEELQATNEEMVAANEELQSTNEELHSVNEELYTVNAEHQKRVKELDEANADMNNLLATTQVGVVFLDKSLTIRRFSPVIGRMLYMEQHDVGRDFSKFISPIDDDQFMERVSKSMSERKEQHFEIKCNGSSFLTRSMPYWTGAEVAGVVISFVNIDAIKHTESELARFKFMADNHIDAQAMVDEDGNFVYVNDQMCKNLDYSVHEMLNMKVVDVDTEVDLQSLENRFTATKESGGRIFESTHIRKDGTRFPVEVASTYVEFDGAPYLFSSIRDVTSRRQANRRRRLLEKAIDSVESGIIISDPNEKDNPLTFVNAGFEKVTGYTAEESIGHNCRFLQGEGTDPATVVAIRDGLRKAEPTKVLIRNYRKDGTPFWNDIFITPVKDRMDAVVAFVGVQNDVTSQIESKAKLEERERTIRSLLNSTAEGIYGQDLDGRCTFINKSALKMLGYSSAEELVGKQMHDVIHFQRADGSDYPASECPIHRTIGTGVSTTSDSDVFTRSDGSMFPVELWCHPLMNEDECTGAVVAFVDMTVRKKELEEIKAAREAAETANQAKSRFLANMSHELRTPLAAILGFTQIMEEDADDEEATDRLATIRRNGEYLLRLLNDILDLSRIEADKLQTIIATARLADLLSDVNDTMQMRANGNRTSLKFHLSNPLPVTISIDPARLRQILINLIGNAIKFSPGGNVEVSVSLDQNKETQGNILQVEVRDNGIGISENQLKTLFQPFAQADASIAKRFGGTGLGLSISNRLSQSLGGNISVESCEGEGSCFTVRIPVDPMGSLAELRLESKTEAANSTSPSSQSIRISANVLIVDDMRDVRFIATHFLKKAGCDVTVAENGLEAITKIENAKNSDKPFDLVLMDVQMPEMDGEEAIEVIREKGINTPVIALTADAMKGTRRRLLSAGFDEYLTKPLDRGALLQAVQYLLSKN